MNAYIICTIWIRNNRFTGGPGPLSRFIDYISTSVVGGEEVSDDGRRGERKNVRKIRCCYHEVEHWKGNSSTKVNEQGPGAAQASNKPAYDPSPL